MSKRSLNIDHFLLKIASISFLTNIFISTVSYASNSESNSIVNIVVSTLAMLLIFQKSKQNGKQLEVHLKKQKY